MKYTVILALLLLAVTSAAVWAIPDYNAASSNTVLGVTVTPVSGPQSLGTIYYSIDISSGAQWIDDAGHAYDITGVCGLAVYPAAGSDYTGQVHFTGEVAGWRLQPASGFGTTGSDGFAWENPSQPIATPATGSTGAIPVGYATYSQLAPPDVQYLLHVYVADHPGSATVWGRPGNTPGTPEPASAALLAVGMAGFVAVRRKKAARQAEKE